MPSFLLTQSALHVAVLLLIALLGISELGYRIGLRRGKHGAGAESGAELITGSLLTLLALLLGFTLSMAESRYSAMAGPLRDDVKAGIREYLADRIAFYRAPSDRRQLEALSERTDRVESRIWRGVRSHVRESPRSSSTLVIINSINEMFDSRTAQEGQFRLQIPQSITDLLLLSSILAVALVGFSLGLSGTRHLVFTSMLSLVLALTLFVTLALDRPRKGLIWIPPTDLVELQARIQKMPTA